MNFALLLAGARDKIKRSVVGLVVVFPDFRQSPFAAFPANFISNFLPTMDGVPPFLGVTPNHNIQRSITHSTRQNRGSGYYLLAPCPAFRAFLVARLLPYRTKMLQNDIALAALELISH